MNREETKAAIAVMQAYVDGAEIEYRSEGEWLSLRDIQPVWNWPECDYRIAKRTKKVKLLAWIGEAKLHWVEENVSNTLSNYGWKRVPTADRVEEIEE